MVKAYLSDDLREAIHGINVPMGTFILNCVNPTDLLKEFVQVLHHIDCWYIVNFICMQNSKKQIKLIFWEGGPWKVHWYIKSAHLLNKWAYLGFEWLQSCTILSRQGYHSEFSGSEANVWAHLWGPSLLSSRRSKPVCLSVEYLDFYKGNLIPAARKSSIS